MDQYLTKKNLMIGGGVLVVVIIIIIIVVKSKKDSYIYTGGTPSTTNNKAGTSTSWPTVVLKNTGAISLPSPSAALSVVADTTGNLAVAGLFPVGGIIMWAGSTLPPNWALCDGTQGTPDLRGRFIVGIGGVSPLTNLATGDIGGEEFHQLNVAEMPSHSHSQGEICGGSDCPNNGGGWYGNGAYNWNTAATGGDSTNSSATLPHNNMPPFYALAYIMKMM